jgi:hypothetical protein
VLCTVEVVVEVVSTVVVVTGTTVKLPEAKIEETQGTSTPYVPGVVVEAPWDQQVEVLQSGLVVTVQLPPDEAVQLMLPREQLPPLETVQEVVLVLPVGNVTEKAP